MYWFKKTCTSSKRICTGLKKYVPVQKELELVLIQIVPKDKLNYNIYFFVEIAIKGFSFTERRYKSNYFLSHYFCTGVHKKFINVAFNSALLVVQCIISKEEAGIFIPINKQTKPISLHLDLHMATT